MTNRWLTLALAIALVATLTAGGVAYAQDDPQPTDPTDTPQDEPTDEPADEGGVDQTDSRAVAEAYAKAVNEMDGEAIADIMEPVETETPERDNGDAMPEPPEYPKTTMKVLDAEPWKSDDGVWIAYVVEVEMVMAEGAEPTVTKYGQWVMQKDGKWWIPTVSAANAPMTDPTYLEWMMKLYE